MNRVVFAAVLVCASVSAASAGTYVGLGIGSVASVSDTSGTPYASDGRSARLALGWRMAWFSVEGAYSGYGLIKGNAADGGQYDSRTLQAAGKVSYPLGNNFEVFGRAGFGRTWLSPAISTRNMELSGDGYILSAGFEYRLDLGLAGGSIFVDYSHNTASLTGTGSAQLDQTATMWTLGVNLSI